MAMTDEQYQQRIAEISARTTDIKLESDFRKSIHRILTATIENYDEIDPYILDMDKECIQQLAKVLASPEDTINISQNDMFEIEKICLCGERWVEDLGDIQLTSAEIGIIAKKIIAFRRLIFTEK